MSHENRTIEPERSHEPHEVRDARVRLVAELRSLGEPVATRIVRNDIVVVAQRGNQGGPARRAVREPVRQQERRLVPTAAEVVKPDTVRGHIPRVHGHEKSATPAMATRSAPVHQEPGSPSQVRTLWWAARRSSRIGWGTSTYANACTSTSLPDITRPYESSAGVRKSYSRAGPCAS